MTVTVLGVCVILKRLWEEGVYPRAAALDRGQGGQLIAIEGQLGAGSLHVGDHNKAVATSKIFCEGLCPSDPLGPPPAAGGRGAGTPRGAPP